MENTQDMLKKMHWFYLFIHYYYLELRDRIGDPSDHADFWTFSRSFQIPDF